MPPKASDLFCGSWPTTSTPSDKPFHILYMNKTFSISSGDENYLNFSLNFRQFVSLFYNSMTPTLLFSAFHYFSLLFTTNSSSVRKPLEAFRWIANSRYSFVGWLDVARFKKLSRNSWKSMTVHFFIKPNKSSSQTLAISPSRFTLQSETNRRHRGDIETRIFT